MILPVSSQARDERRFTRNAGWNGDGTTRHESCGLAHRTRFAADNLRLLRNAQLEARRFRIGDHGSTPALEPLRIFQNVLTAGSIIREEAPRRISQGLAGHPIGVAVMGRLAVDASQQGEGLGATLLQDALMRVEQAGDMIAIRAALVQTINDTARDFYLRFGFSPSSMDELRLMLLMKDLRAFLRTR